MDAFFTQLLVLLQKFPAYVPFLMILLIVGGILYRAHKSSRQFTIFDLIEDKNSGKGSLEKVGMLTAMLSLTWWFIDKTASDQTNVEDVLAYGGIMGLAKFASNWLSAAYNKPPNDTIKDKND